MDVRSRELRAARREKHLGLSFWEYVLKERLLYIMMTPVIVYFLVFHYLPLLGAVIAFQDYRPMRGFVHSRWVGLRHFVSLFTSVEFFIVLRNTLIISFLKLAFGFPAPIILALLLNEVRHSLFKRSVQTISYLPHFLSWVIIGGMMTSTLSLHGPVNALGGFLGFEKRLFLLDASLFRGIIVVTDIWREVGWGSLLYLAAISSINPELYESAVIDGAGRWRQTWSITIPSIRSVIIILLILQIGYFMSAGFEQILILQNPLVRDVSEIIDTYVYKRGLLGTQYSFATAVGFFKSIVGLMLIAATNYLARRMGAAALW